VIWLFLVYLRAKNKREQIDEINSQLFLVLGMVDVLMLHFSILCSSNIWLVVRKATKLIEESIFGHGNEKESFDERTGRAHQAIYC